MKRTDKPKKEEFENLSPLSKIELNHKSLKNIYIGNNHNIPFNLFSKNNDFKTINHNSPIREQKERLMPFLTETNTNNFDINNGSQNKKDTINSIINISLRNSEIVSEFRNKRENLDKILNIYNLPSLNEMNDILKEKRKIDQEKRIFVNSKLHERQKYNRIGIRPLANVRINQRLEILKKYGKKYEKENANEENKKNENGNKNENNN